MLYKYKYRSSNYLIHNTNILLSVVANKLTISDKQRAADKKLFLSICINALKYTT